MNISPSHDLRDTYKNEIWQERISDFADTYQQVLAEIRLATRFVPIEAKHEEMVLCRAYADCWGLERCGGVSPIIVSWSYQQENPNDVSIMNKTLHHFRHGLNMEGTLLCAQGVVSFDALQQYFESLVHQQLEETRLQHPNHEWVVAVNALESNPRSYTIDGWDHQAVKEMCQNILAQNQFKKIQSHLMSNQPSSPSSKI